MAEKEIAVKVHDLTKMFRIPVEASSGLKQKLINTLKGRKGYREFTPLNDISFEIEKGDFFGIVGRNGSGKSTLLKTIAGIYTPNGGSVQVNGTLVPFIELGVGFNPDLTGRENVYLNGALLGFSRKEMDAMYEDIVDFAELHDFMEERLKNYSSGMQVRLAFSIAIRADSDILLLDEVLAVGDEAFQKKCYQYFANLKKNNKTVILVTHSMDSVQQFCNKAIMLEKGKIILEGNPAKVAQGYREQFMPVFASNPNKKTDDDLDRGGSQPVSVKAKLTKGKGEVSVSVTLTPRMDLGTSIVSLFIDRDTGEQVYRFSSDEKIGKPFDLKKGQAVKINLTLQDIFPNGIFALRASVKSADRTNEYASIGELASFEIDRRLETGSQWDIHWQPNETFSIEE